MANGIESSIGIVSVYDTECGIVSVSVLNAKSLYRSPVTLMTLIMFLEQMLFLQYMGRHGWGDIDYQIGTLEALEMHTLFNEVHT